MHDPPDRRRSGVPSHDPPSSGLAWYTRLEVREAGDLDFALSLLLTQHFDLVLLDHTMPHGTALDGLRTVHARHPELPIIIHTGYLSPEHRAAAVVEGARDVVTKGAFAPLWAAILRACPQLGSPVDPHGQPALGRTVLVVEDDEGVRWILERTLREAGYGVVVAEHGKRALELLSSLPRAVDLVLADVRMPAMGGAELGRILGATRADLPIVYMSGWPAWTSRLGPSARMMPKPFTPERVLREVEAVFQPRSWA